MSMMRIAGALMFGACVSLLLDGNPIVWVVIVLWWGFSKLDKGAKP